ncbi:MAG: DUF1415 domain-containing protein [Bacteroidota bacterium]
MAKPGGPVELTKLWVKEIVIKHQLCPFAKHPFEKGRIRYVEIEETAEATILEQFEKEANTLLATTAVEVETSLLILTNSFSSFLKYWDFIEQIEDLVFENNLEGILQVASFHPDYQFAGTLPTDPENYTNRSPFPMIHLLREQSVEQAVLSHPDIERVPIRNVEYMRKYGSPHWQNELEKIQGAID